MHPLSAVIFLPSNQGLQSKVLRYPGSFLTGLFGAEVASSGRGQDAGLATGDGLGVGGGVEDGEGVGLGSGDGVGTGLGEVDGDGDGVGDAEGEGTGVGDGEGDGVGRHVPAVTQGGRLSKMYPHPLSSRATVTDAIARLTRFFTQNTSKKLSQRP